VIYSADPANAKLYAKVLGPFEAKHHIKVQIISYTSANFIQQFSSAVNSKAQADVLLANGQDVRYLLSHGLVTSLGKSVDTSDLVPAAYQPFTINGNLYAAGIYGVNVTGFVYNKAVFDKYGLTPPTTMDQLFSDAKKLRGSGIAPVSVPGATIYFWPIWLMQMLQQTSRNAPTKTTFSTLQSGSPAFSSSVYRDALAEMAALGKNQVFQNGYKGTQENQAVSLFASGKAAMFFGGSWDIDGIATQNPKLQLEAIPFPNFVPGVTSAAFGGASIAAAVYGHVDPSRKALAQQMVAYLASAAADKQLVANEGATLPTVKSVKLANVRDIDAQLAQKLVPTESTFLDWYWPKQVTSAVQQDMDGVVDGSMSPAAASADLQSAYQAAKTAGYKFN
jgi:raffinose/stachyose/melibiose transport system substrate-binding protein